MSTIAPSARPRVARPGSGDEAESIARDAYVYLFPLVLMEVARRQSQGVEVANSFNHLRALGSGGPRAVARPGSDTLYSVAWLDLTEGPVVVSIVDTGTRTFVLPMIDMWTDVFAVPGSRTCGREGADFAVVPPRWGGTLPAGVTRIDASTPHVRILGRTRTGGRTDAEAIALARDAYRIASLDDWGWHAGRVEPRLRRPAEARADPARLVAEMPAPDFFELGAEAMKVNPPHPTDWSILRRMRRIGVAPGRHLPAGGTGMLERAASAGLKRMRARVPTIARVTSGWRMRADGVGTHGDFYLRRAAIALAGLGADQPGDAIHLLDRSDADGRPVRAGNAYVLHFERGELPPVGAFWSLRISDRDGAPVPNPLGRHAIGDRDALAFNPDGSLDLWIQRECPGRGREPNWLPAPEKGAFRLSMRLYAPGAPEAAGRWSPPALRLAR